MPFVSDKASPHTTKKNNQTHNSGNFTKKKKKKIGLKIVILDYFNNN